MNKSDGLRIGLDLNHIAMHLDDVTLAKVKTYMKEIEKICLKEMEKDDRETVHMEVKALMCDHYCKYPDNYTDNDRLIEEQCDKCPLNRL